MLASIGVTPKHTVALQQGWKRRLVAKQSRLFQPEQIRNPRPLERNEKSPMFTTVTEPYLTYPNTSPAGIDTVNGISRHTTTGRLSLRSGQRHVTHGVTGVGRVVAVGQPGSGAGTCARTGGADTDVCGVAEQARQARPAVSVAGVVCHDF